MQIRIQERATAEETPSPAEGRALSVAVVGGGVAGLSAARALQEDGHRVLVLDKGRAPSGRASTRRTADFAFDHGAQYFTVRDDRFRAEVERWADERFVAPWNGRIVALGYDGQVDPIDDGLVRYVGVPGMSALCGYLAAGIEVEARAEVTGMHRAAGCWRVTGPNEDYGAFDRVLVTLPAPQAARLLDAAPVQQEVARSARFRPCWAVMLGLAERYAVDFDGAFVSDSSLAWVARSSSKPGRPDPEAWVLHAAPTWSGAYSAATPDVVLERLTAELESRTGVALPEIVHGVAHLWGYSLPDPPIREGDSESLYDPELGIALAGDWCAGGRVEGAYLSGLAAAERLTAQPVLG